MGTRRTSIMRSLACYLTPVSLVILSLLCCPVCRGDMRRPPLDDLRVPAKEPGEQAALGEWTEQALCTRTDPEVFLPPIR